MRSPVLAISWQIWRRHRWVLAGTILLLLSIAFLFQVQPFGSLDARDLELHRIFLSMLFAFLLTYVAAAFAFGAEMPLEASASGYPSWMFTLPVSTHTLVFWPMLQSVLVIGGLGEAWAQFVLRPAGFTVEPGLAAALLGAFVAVLQAILWMPFPLPWLRLFAAVLLMPVLITLPQLWYMLYLDQTILVGVLLGLIPVAYVAAFVGVSRARSSAGAEWRWLPRRVSNAPERALRPFSSPAQAQLWLEWRLHGKWVFFILGSFFLYPIVLLLFFLDPVQSGGEICRGLFTFPLLEAFMVGYGLGKVSPWYPPVKGLSSFIAARPLRSTTIIAAKFKVALLRTLAAWGMTLVLLLAILVYLGQYKGMRNWGDLVLGRLSPLEGVVVLMLLIGLTWLLLIQNLFVALSGRKWIGYLSGGVGFLLLMAVASYFGHPERFNLRASLPWVAGGLIVLKLFLAGWFFRALHRRGLVSAPALALGAGVWLGAVLLVSSLLIYLSPTERIPTSWYAFGAVLLLPLARPAAAPLALEWNRHR
jgi:hypothetical protein